MLLVLKKNITFLFIIFCSFQLFSQNTAKVTVEGKLTSEEIRRQKVRDKIRVLEKSFYADKRKFDNLNNNIRRTGSFSSFKKEDIVNFISRCDKALQFANSMNLDGRHKEIVALYKSVGIKKSTDSFDSLIKNIKRFKFNANNELNEKIKKDKKEKSNKLIDALNSKKHKSTIAELDKESKKLDNLLERKKKSKNIDDFLKSKNITNKTLISLTTKSTKTKSLKSLTKKNKKSKSLSNKINKTLTDKNKGVSFKIINRINDISGVVDGSGKTIIPFRKWKINSYKYGIAKVSIPFDSFKCTAFDEFAWKEEFATYATAYKVGFVDESGSFIDGFEVEVSGGGVYRGIWLTSYPRNETYAQREARERRAKIREQKKSAAKKRCLIEVKRWKLSMTSRY